MDKNVDGIFDFYHLAHDWILNYGPKIIIAIIILIIGELLIKFIRKEIAKALNKPRLDAIRPYLMGLINVVLQLILFLVIMPVLGIKMTIFTAIFAAMGVAAGLALSGTLQNFASGILILLLRPYRPGDNIITQGQEGTVSSIQLFFTVVTSFDNKTIIVPNSKLSNEVIFNLSRKGTRRIDIELKFNYGIDFDHLQSLVSKTILNSAGLLPVPKHRVAISSLDPDGYKVVINTWAMAHEFIDTKYELNRRILEELKKDGIKLPGL